MAAAKLGFAVPEPILQQAQYTLVTHHSADFENDMKPWQLNKLLQMNEKLIAMAEGGQGIGGKGGAGKGNQGKGGQGGQYGGSLGYSGGAGPG